MPGGPAVVSAVADFTAVCAAVALVGAAVRLATVALVGAAVRLATVAPVGAASVGVVDGDGEVPH
jgi:hypothetical protein